MHGKKPAHVARGRTAAFIMLVSAGVASLTWSACGPAPTDLTELAEGSVAAETWQPKTADAFRQPDGEGDDHDPSTDGDDPGGDDPGDPALRISHSVLDFGPELLQLTFTLKKSGGGLLA
jgi:hypothetical protein